MLVLWSTSIGDLLMCSCISKVHRSGAMSSNVPLQLHINKFVLMSLKVCIGLEWCSPRFHFNGISKKFLMPLQRCTQAQSDILHVLQGSTSMGYQQICSYLSKGGHRSRVMFSDVSLQLDISWCVPMPSEVCTGPEWCSPWSTSIIGYLLMCSCVLRGVHRSGVMSSNVPLQLHINQ
jgi:hypothetical protein